MTIWRVGGIEIRKLPGAGFSGWLTIPLTAMMLCAAMRGQQTQTSPVKPPGAVQLAPTPPGPIQADPAYSMPTAVGSSQPGGTQAPAKPTEQPSTQPGLHVATGSVIGDETSQTQRMLRLIEDLQFHHLEQMLEDAHDGKDALPAEQQQFLQGILANRKNHPEESIRALEPLIPSIAASGNVTEEKLARQALAEDYLRSGRLADAATAYKALESRIGKHLTQDEQDDLEQPLKLLPLAADHPPMTVQAAAPFSLPYELDPLGLTDIPVFVDGVSHSWMLDPTEPFNLISSSTAHEVGLTLSAETATIHSLTGRAMTVHSTVIPRLTLGNVTYRNMTAFVFNDADFAFPESGYQVRGVLGYPVVSALGSLTVTSDATIQVQPRTGGERLTDGAPFYLDGERVLVALGKADGADDRLYAVDAAGQQSYLTSRFFSEHAPAFAQSRMQLLHLTGMENAPPVPAYLAQTVRLEVGKKVVVIHDIQVLTQPLDGTANDDTYGTLGVDVLQQFASYAFDYRTMRFTVSPH